MEAPVFLPSSSTSRPRAGRRRRGPRRTRQSRARLDRKLPGVCSGRPEDQVPESTRPAPRERLERRAARAESWRRPTAESSRSSNDWTPTETRVIPAATQSRAASGVTSSGFASSVTSARGEDVEAAADAVRAIAASVRRRRQRRRAASQVNGVERSRPWPLGEQAPSLATRAPAIRRLPRTRRSRRRTRSSRSATGSTEGARRGRKESDDRAIAGSGDRTGASSFGNVMARRRASTASRAMVRAERKDLWAGCPRGRSRARSRPDSSIHLAAA